MKRTGNLRLIWSSKQWLLLFAAVAAVVVYIASSQREDKYEGRALGQIVSTSQAAGEILSEEQLLSVSNIYNELADTDAVREIAHEDPKVKGKAEEFDDSVGVEPEERIGLLGFTAVTPSPTEAADFANAYATAFATYLEQLQVEQRTATLRPIQARIDEINEELPSVAGTSEAAGLQVELQALQDRSATETATPGDSMRVVERAVPPSDPASPKPKRDALIALIVALVLGACAIYLRDLFFDRYGSAEEASRDLGLPLLGEIPKGRGNPALESFRSLRTAMMLALEQSVRAKDNGARDDRPQGASMLITGAESGCGKSYIAANISRTLAGEGRQVVIVDADLRRPTQHEIFGVPLSPGLSDILVREQSPHVSELTVSVSLPPGSAGALGELRVLPAGEHTGDSVEWLSSSRMEALVEELQRANEAVVFDSPPTLVVVDPVVLARYADGVLFVVDSRRTRRRDARRSVEALRAIGAPILGFAFNRSESRQSRYDAYRPRELRRQPWQPKETKV